MSKSEELSTNIQPLNDNEQETIRSESVSHSLVCLLSVDLNFNTCQYGDYSTILRIMSYMLRFVYNCQNKQNKMTGPFSVLELQQAELRVIYIEQHRVFSDEIQRLATNRSIKDSVLEKLNPFLDGNGMLRISTGRCENNTLLSYESKFPLIIPSGHLSELIIRYQHVFLKHSSPTYILNSLRNKFWLISGRRTAVKVVKECSRCCRYDSRPLCQPAPYLPAFRANQSPPFTITGVDHCGPVYCQENAGHKYYILLFTCGVVRACHLELVSSLDLQETLLAFRRFAACRGLPSVIYSDNSQTFLSVRNHFRSVYGFHSPQWRNIPPISPWWGGWWERIVRSVKNAIKKTIHCTTIPYIEMVTLLAEISAVINSRPLTFVSDNHQDTQALTPAHILLGKTIGEQFPVELDVPVSSPRDLQTAFAVREGCIKLFWESWVNEYLRNLPPLASSTSVIKPIVLGTMVLLRDDNKPRAYWPIGRITKLFPGKDNIVRSVEVKLSNGQVFKRSVNCLHHMETYEAESLEFEDFNDSSEFQDVTLSDSAPEVFTSPDADVLDQAYFSDALPVINTCENLDITGGDNSSHVTDNVSDKAQGATNKVTKTTRSGHRTRPPNKLNLCNITS